MGNLRNRIRKKSRRARYRQQQAAKILRNMNEQQQKEATEQRAEMSETSDCITAEASAQLTRIMYEYLLKKKKDQQVEERLAEPIIIDEEEEEQQVQQVQVQREKNKTQSTLIVCQVPCCGHRRRIDSCAFLKLPKHEATFELWKNIMRFSVRPEKGSTICTCHFQRTITVELNNGKLVKQLPPKKPTDQHSSSAESPLNKEEQCWALSCSHLSSSGKCTFFEMPLEIDYNCHRWVEGVRNYYVPCRDIRICKCHFRIFTPSGIKEGPHLKMGNNWDNFRVIAEERRSGYFRTGDDCWVPRCNHKRENCTLVLLPNNAQEFYRWLTYIKHWDIPPEDARICGCHFRCGKYSAVPVTREENAKLFWVGYLHGRFGIPLGEADKNTQPGVSIKCEQTANTQKNQVDNTGQNQLNTTEKPQNQLNATEKPQNQLNATQKPQSQLNTTEKPPNQLNITEKQNTSQLMEITDEPVIVVEEISQLNKPSTSVNQGTSQNVEKPIIFNKMLPNILKNYLNTQIISNKSPDQIVINGQQNKLVPSVLNSSLPPKIEEITIDEEPPLSFPKNELINDDMFAESHNQHRNENKSSPSTRIDRNTSIKIIKKPPQKPKTVRLVMKKLPDDIPGFLKKTFGVQNVNTNFKIIKTTVRKQVDPNKEKGATQNILNFQMNVPRCKGKTSTENSTTVSIEQDSSITKVEPAD